MTHRPSTETNLHPLSAPPGASESAWRCLREDGKRFPAFAWLTERAWWATVAFRLSQEAAARIDRLPVLLHRPARLPLGLLLLCAQAFTGVELWPATRVGPGLRMHHGSGIVINPRTHIGRNVELRHGVTLGNLRAGGPCPTIGDDVEIGAYAQVLGDVTIGAGAKIGAMAVVLQDVPAGATAVGVPARILQRPA